MGGDRRMSLPEGKERAFALAAAAYYAVMVGIAGYRAYKMRETRQKMFGTDDIQATALQLTDKEKNGLRETASALASSGRGILAADESVGTVGKRLEKAGLTNDFETRRRYREVLFSCDGLGEYLAGAILFEETLMEQNHSDGRTFVEVLQDSGVLVGIKTDKGLQPLPYSPKETWTAGMDSLLERSRKYYERGARFAKWRAVIRITRGADGKVVQLLQGPQDPFKPPFMRQGRMCIPFLSAGNEHASLPSSDAVELNAKQLAAYAVISQRAGLVPIVEPEVLIEGDHTAEEFAQVSEMVLGAVYGELARAGVYLEGTLLKPQMMMAGIDAQTKHTREELVDLTLQVLRRRVPPAVPGVMFLSGGQSEEEATMNLSALNVAAAADPRHPWTLSFSFGRSLQGSVLEIWQGRDENNAEAVAMAGALAAANAKAQKGEWGAEAHPSVLSGKSMHDPNRGWQGK
ncbi:unnamed protein product [Chrysoparadoxa australica]